MSLSKFIAGSLRPLLVCGLLVWAPVVWSQAASPAADEWVYRIQPTDTLIGISQTYLEVPGQWPRLQRLNRVADPLRLIPGSTLRIPVAWLRRTATVAEVVYARGEPRWRRGTEAPQPMSTGQTLQAGDAVTTGTQDTVTLRLVDGSRLLIAPDSELAIERLLVLGRSGIPETRLRLDRGNVDSTVTPQPQRSKSYEIRTPTVNLGVRGTQFRAHAEADGRNARVEVLEGGVAAQGRQGSDTKTGSGQRVDAGFGLVAAANAPVEAPRRLIGAPSLGDLPSRLERVPLRFAWPAVDGARGYRAQVYAGASNDQLLLDAKTTEPAARWADLPDGDYRLSVRAIDDAGLEGIDAVRAFKLKARPEPPFTSQPRANGRVYGDRVEFAWARSAAAQRYRLQVSASPDFAVLLHDLPDLTATQTALDLPHGTYHWRIASIAADGDQGPFSDPQNFLLRAPPASPAVEPPQLDDASLTLRWKAAEPGESFEYQIARDAAFTDIVQQGRGPESQVTVQNPRAGSYYLRIRTVIDADGQVGPYGPPQQVEVPISRWWLLVPPAAVLLLML